MATDATKCTFVRIPIPDASVEMDMDSDGFESGLPMRGETSIWGHDCPMCDEEVTGTRVLESENGVLSSEVSVDEEHPVCVRVEGDETAVYLH